MWQLHTMHLRYVTTYFQNLIHRHCVLFLAPELIFYLSERPQNVSTAAGLCILLQVFAGNENQTSPQRSFVTDRSQMSSPHHRVPFTL